MSKRIFILIITLFLLIIISSLAEGFPGLTYTDTLPLKYAERFTIDCYQGGYRLITIEDGDTMLVVPEGMDVPADVPEGVIVLQQPLDNIYLAATSAMSLFDRLDSVDAVTLSALEASRWSVESARNAMENGDMVYAGKYSEPDYELLVLSRCDLAIESTMIFHAPKVREMIELLGIPVIVDRSSYESHPLGRTEWIKLYGALLGREEEAERFFDQAVEAVSQFEEYGITGKRVAFFYVNQDGSVVVRAANDYIPKMIELAGGQYALTDILDADNERSSETISMEAFYAAARDADCLIYYTTIATPLDSIQALKDLNTLFADFAAVQSGEVYTTGTDLYQETDRVSDLIVDLAHVLRGEEDMYFLKKLS